jgi:hypothetical protein
VKGEINKWQEAHRGLSIFFLQETAQINKQANWFKMRTVYYWFPADS